MLRELVSDHDSLFISSGVAEPRMLIDELLMDVVPGRKSLRLFQVLTGSEGRLVEAARGGHRLSTPAPGMFGAAACGGGLDLIGMSMRQCAAAMETGCVAVDGALVSAVRVGDDLWLAPATDLAPIAFERARFRAVEVLPGWHRPPTAPRFSVADAEYIVEGVAAPAASVPPPPTDVARAIGTMVSDLVPAGAVTELGVGGALTAVPDRLAEAGRPVAVHGGLVSDWLRKLVEGEVATVPLDCAGGRSVVAAVASGSPTFGDWLAESDAVAFADSRHAHDPGHLMNLRPFVAINSAPAVDLRGQVGFPAGAAAGYAPGGLMDFAIAGAYGGLSIIALASQARDGASRIVENLDAVHLPASLVSHVVTEYGIAELRGRSLEERRKALVEIAHPDHQRGLARAASS